jgi:hypothetical protein
MFRRTPNHQHSSNQGENSSITSSKSYNSNNNHPLYNIDSSNSKINNSNNGTVKHDTLHTSNPPSSLPSNTSKVTRINYLCQVCLGATSSKSTTTIMTLISIGFLLIYTVLFQYFLIRSKDAIIHSLLTTQQSQLQLQLSGMNAILSTNTMLFNPKRSSMLDVFRMSATTNEGQTTTTTATSSCEPTMTRGVGIFPLRKPNQINTSAIEKWIPYSSFVLTKVSYPIFVVSLPKSGTTSIWKYFQCGQQESCHNWIQGPTKGSKSTLLGKCIEQNIVQYHVPPFQNCGPYDVYTDTGVRVCELVHMNYVSFLNVLLTIFQL